MKMQRHMKIYKENYRKIYKRVSAAVCILAISMSCPSFAGPGIHEGRRMVGGEGMYGIMYEEEGDLVDVFKRTAELPGLSAKSIITLNREGQPGPRVIYSDMKYRNRDTADLKYQVYLRSEPAGTSEDVHLFYTDGYYCMEEGGEKVKVSMDYEKAGRELNFDPNSIGITGLKYVQDLQAAEDGSGNRFYTYTYAPDELDPYFGGICQQLDLLWADNEVKEMKGSLLVNPGGFCTAQTMDILLDITDEGGTAAAEIKVEIIYSNPGQPVEFELPSTDEYIEP